MRRRDVLVEQRKEDVLFVLAAAAYFCLIFVCAMVGMFPLAVLVAVVCSWAELF